MQSRQKHYANNLTFHSAKASRAHYEDRVSQCESLG